VTNPQRQSERVATSPTCTLSGMLTTWGAALAMRVRSRGRDSFDGGSAAACSLVSRAHQRRMRKPQPADLQAAQAHERDGHCGEKCSTGPCSSSYRGPLHHDDSRLSRWEARVAKRNSAGVPFCGQAHHGGAISRLPPSLAQWWACRRGFPCTARVFRSRSARSVEPASSAALERRGECGWAIPWQPLGCLRCSVVRAAMHCPQQGELQREAHDARGVILGLPACCPDHWGRRPPRPITGVLLSPRPPRCIPPLPSQEEAGAPSHALS
jgi:hypothetical protein